MALIQVDDSNFQKISNFTNVPPDQIQDTDLITGLHNGGNANFRIYDIVSKVMAGIDIDPGQDPGYDPGGDLGEQVTYSVIIDHSKSDPRKMVEYADDAVGQRPGWSNWKTKPIFKKMKDCLIDGNIAASGSVIRYLNPNNLAEDINGNSFSENGTFMLELPERLGYRFTWLDGTNTRLKVSVTNRPNAAGFDYSAFSYKNYNDCDKIYIGTMKGWLYNGLLMSSRGNWNNSPSIYPAVNQSITAFRNAARALGDGFEITRFSTITLMQALAVICECTLDLQTAIAKGWVNQSASHYVYTSYKNGFCNELFTGDKSDGKSPVRYLGLEDFWGNVSEFIDGIRTDSANHLLLYDHKTGEWVDYGSIGSSNNAGYISKPRGGSLGFVGMEFAGSATTKYCDYSELFTNNVASYGGDYNYQNEAGPFQLSCVVGENENNKHRGARLMYFHRG